MAISDNLLFRLKPVSGQASPSSVVGAEETLSGGTATLVDLGGGVFAWEFTGALSSATIPTKVIDPPSDNGGATLAITFRRVAAPTVGGQTIVAWSKSDEAAGILVRRGSAVAEDIGFRALFSSQSTAAKTGVLSSTLQTYVFKLACKNASLQDIAMLWVQQVGRVGTSPDATGAGDNLSQQSINTVRINPTNGGDYQIVDLVLWGRELTDAECASIADNLRGVLDAIPAGPTISTQPTAQTAVSGSNFTFTVVAAASGGGTLSYQWQKNGSNISSATSASYTGVAGTNGVNTDVFRVVVTETGGSNPGSITSSAVTLTVTAGNPTITAHPSNQSVTAPGTVPFSVTATASSGTLTYQWQRSTNGGSTWANVVGGSGATTSSYTSAATSVSGGNANNNDLFSCVVSDANGSVRSNSALLTVSAAASGPTITSQPSNQSVSAGSPASFSVAATTSGGILGYQWFRSTNGGSTWSTISSATLATYTTPSTTISGGAANNNDIYRVAVTDNNGTTVSNMALLTVISTTGILGSVILAETSIGQNGVGLLNNEASVPGKENVRFTYTILAAPSEGIFEANPNGSFSFKNAPDGVHYVVYRVDEDGVPTDVVTSSITVGTPPEVPVTRGGGFARIGLTSDGKLITLFP